jgi:hypothetical protein
LTREESADVSAGADIVMMMSMDVLPV